MRIQTSNKNYFILDGETRIGMESICITHSYIPLYTVYMQHIMAHSGGMQEWVIQIPSIPILVSVLFPSLHLKYFRIKFLLPYRKAGCFLFNGESIFPLSQMVDKLQRKIFCMIFYLFFCCQHIYSTLW